MMTRAVAACSVVATVPTAVADEPDPADPWAPVRILVGEWKGVGRGFGGESQVRHTYDFILQEHFIRSTTVSAGTGSRRISTLLP